MLGAQSYGVELAMHKDSVFGTLMPKEKGLKGIIAGNPRLSGNYCLVQDGSWLTSSLDMYVRGIDVGDWTIEGAVEPALQLHMPADTVHFTTTLLPDSSDKALYTGNYDDGRFKVHVEYHQKNKTVQWSASNDNATYRFNGVIKKGNKPLFPCPSQE